MDYYLRVNVTCPYCGFVNQTLPDAMNNLELRYCDLESGGCDKPFVYRVILTPEVETMKVETE